MVQLKQSFVRMACECVKKKYQCKTDQTLRDVEAACLRHSKGHLGTGSWCGKHQSVLQVKSAGYVK